MEKSYLTSEGTPVKTNCPQPGWTEISDEDYIKIRDQKNKQAEDEEKAREEAMKPELERQKLIHQRALDNAEQELINEGVIQPKEIKGIT